ncbi:MAG: hypothetical protein AAGN35_21225 [Bacteroidota bacterium]
MIENLRRFAASAEVETGRLVYDALGQVIRLNSAPIVEGSFGKVKRNGEYEILFSEGQVIATTFRTDDIYQGLYLRYLRNDSMLVVLPDRGDLGGEQGRLYGPLVRSLPGLHFVIVPESQDSFSLGFRVKVSPEQVGFRRVILEDITSVHLLGPDLNSRAFIRFEQGREYYAVDLFRGIEHNMQLYQRPQSERIALRNTSLRRLKQELQEIDLDEPGQMRNAKRCTHQLSRWFNWELGFYPSECESDFFYQRSYDDARPFLPVD